jgi:hypothetical protein
MSNSVNYRILILKLKQISFFGNLLKQFGSFLVNRHQQVKVKGYLSSKFNVTSGVSQGGHLSPLLFLVFLFNIGYSHSIHIYIPI